MTLEIGGNREEATISDAYEKGAAGVARVGRSWKGRAARVDGFDLIWWGQKTYIAVA